VRPKLARAAASVSPGSASRIASAGTLPHLPPVCATLPRRARRARGRAAPGGGRDQDWISPIPLVTRRAWA
jgi:hypothetical protein